MLIDETILLDPSPLEAMDNFLSIKHALRTMVLVAANKAHVRTLLACLKTTVHRLRFSARRRLALVSGVSYQGGSTSTPSLDSPT